MPRDRSLALAREDPLPPQGKTLMGAYEEYHAAVTMDVDVGG